MKRLTQIALLLLFTLGPTAVFAVEEASSSGEPIGGISNLIIIVGVVAVLFVGVAMAGRNSGNGS